jgi:single-stranded-DNA-specific exonuclease
MQKEWVIKSRGDEQDVASLAKSLNIGATLSNLLVQRGVKTYDQAKLFFRPSLKNLYDPFLMKDMDKAVSRLQLAIKRNEGILVYGDYDVDGTTSVALVYAFLNKRYKNMDFYIPDRYSEGYGVSYKGIDYAINKNYTLIITLDCGIKANQKIDYANHRGVDVIICDHHNPGIEIPKAFAVLDPKQKDCHYPFKELSGCGVGFKYMLAYARSEGIDDQEVFEYIDLVTVSIASDIVPIIDENRVIAHFGLVKLSENPLNGLKAIMKISGLEDVKNVHVDDIVFKIGPRINAAGRMESGKKSVELLISDDEAFAADLSYKINTFNNQRRNIDNIITQEALKLLGDNPEYQHKKTTVLYNPSWHKGVIGIVASRLTETYYRPTVVLTHSNGFATGSARSVFGFDLYQAIDSCSDLLESFGGHMYAAGLTLRPENVSKFIARFEDFVVGHIHPEQLIPKLEIDAELKFSEITTKFFKVLDQFRPFGPGNMAPLFFTENVSDVGRAKPVGANQEHLKLDLIHEDTPFTPITAIAFGQAHYLPAIKRSPSFDVAYSIAENNFMGKTSLQLVVKDIKL